MGKKETERVVVRALAPSLASAPSSPLNLITVWGPLYSGKYLILHAENETFG